ncbi:MAG: NUDIX domain-containing protein [Patescibacteria group bacterium]
MSEEMLTLVDKDDKLVGEELRDKCHRQGLWHRASTIFVLNSKDEVLIQRRAPNMSHPNKWCSSASGHVLTNETYEQAAKRELKEELGIECDFKEIGKLAEQTIGKPDEIENEYNKVYVCYHEGPFKIQKEELTEVRFISIPELRKEIEQDRNNFTPGFLLELRYFLENRGY